MCDIPHGASVVVTYRFVLMRIHLTVNLFLHVSITALLNLLLLLLSLVFVSSADFTQPCRLRGKI